MSPLKGPHQGQPILYAGASLEHAKTAMVMLHGRGASAQDILRLVPDLNQPDFAYIAPQAARNTWYPHSFLSQIPQNEPGLSSGLRAIADVLDHLAGAGFPPERIVLLGFSQGACLTLEFIARHARRYGGIAGLSGGLIGPDGTPRNYTGSLESTPIFLGCSDVDPHIPKERVLETTAVLQKMYGNVTERLYPGMGHTINQDEINFVKSMMTAML